MDGTTEPIETIDRARREADLLKLREETLARYKQVAAEIRDLKKQLRAVDFLLTTTNE